MVKKKMPDPERRSVRIELSGEDFRKLDAICRERGQSKSDFLRGAMQVADQVPNINTRPLVGACLKLHQQKVAREKREQRKKQQPKSRKG